MVQFFKKRCTSVNYTQLNSGFVILVGVDDEICPNLLFVFIFKLGIEERYTRLNIGFCYFSWGKLLKLLQLIIPFSILVGYRVMLRRSMKY